MADLKPRMRPGVLVFLTLIAIVVGVLLVRLTDTGASGSEDAPAGDPVSTSVDSGSTPTPDPATPASAADGIPAAASPAVVEYVHDGDTLFLEDGRKVRLLGVNTPEIGGNAECYGEEATELLRDLLPEGSEVQVLEDVEPLDQYGRSLLFVYSHEGINVNLELLELGAAEVEMYRPNVLFADEVHAAEDSARAAGLGLWGAC